MKLIAVIGLALLFGQISFAQGGSTEQLTASDVLSLQETLAKFGYGTVFTGVLDETTRAAVRKYQARSGLPVTGELNTQLWTRLAQDELALSQRIPIGPLYQFSGESWNDYVAAEGVWLVESEEPNASTPAQGARIECLKSANLCIVATVGETLINFAWFDIERWDQYEVVTEPYDLPCGRSTVHISRAEKTVLMIETAAYKNEEACTKLFGYPGKQTVSRLGDVTKISNARLKAIREASDRIKVIPPAAKTILQRPTK